MSQEEPGHHLPHAHSPHLNHGTKRISFLKSPVVSSFGDDLTCHDSQDSIQPDPGARHHLWANDASMRDTPQFQRHSEATSIELFFDLFFVANLTTFTTVHEINGKQELKSFIGFFGLLWFTWCQVSFFDVRFVADSVLERLAKSCQFGAMVGLAVVGPNFTPDAQIMATFRTLAIILSASRIMLAVQYLMVLFHVRSYKHTKTPLAIMTSIYIIAGLIYGFTWFGFKKSEPQGYTYVAWYVVSAMETILNIAVATRWKVVSFNGTHLVQRMSLLTLIILGEGIINVCESIGKLVTSENTKDAWTSPTIGSVVSCIVIIYFLYMLYFDWISQHSFTSNRQQIWALLHLPFHVALVIFLEGAAQFIVWRKIIEVLNFISDSLTTTYDTVKSRTDLSLEQLEGLLSKTVNDIFDFFPPKQQETYVQVDKILNEISTLTANTTLSNIRNGTSISNATLKAIDDQVNYLFYEIQSSILDMYGIDPPEGNSTIVQSPEDISTQNSSMFDLVYVYFFVCAGLTLVLMNTLNIISQRKRIWSDWFRIVFNFVVAATFLVLAGIHETNASQAFALSDWILPTVALMMLVVLVVSHLHRFSLRRGARTHKA